MPAVRCHTDAALAVTRSRRVSAATQAGSPPSVVWNDPRVLLEIGKTPYEHLVVLDEFYRSDCHVEDAIAWLKSNDKPDGTIYAEHEPAEINKFQQAGASVEKAEKSIDAGISEVRKRLEPDGNSVAEASGTVQRLTWGGQRDEKQRREQRAEKVEENPRVGLLISDECHHTVREFLGYKEEHVGKGHAEDHCLDAPRYAVMGGSGGPVVVRRKAQISVSNRNRLPEDLR